VAVTRFVDDVSTLAIEDCLISKLPTLFRSSNVLDMSSEDIARLAGETPASVIERNRLQTKRRTLEAGLHSLKSLHRRMNIVDRSKGHQTGRDILGQMSTMVPSGSDKASIASTSRAEPASQTIIHEEPSQSPGILDIPPTTDEWRYRPELRGETNDPWGVPPESKKVKKKKKSLKQGIDESPFSSFNRDVEYEDQ
jgi:hypothetical protein